MPVRLLGRRERPLESIGGQPLTNVRIVDDVAVVIIVGKGMAIDRVVQRERHHREQ